VTKEVQDKKTTKERGRKREENDLTASGGPTFVTCLEKKRAYKLGEKKKMGRGWKERPMT